MADGSARGKANRRKGHDFEREFCRWVRDEFGVEFGRNLKQYGCAQEGDTDPIAGFLPECKAHGPKYQTRAYKAAAWAQAVVQASKRGLLPLVVWKIPRQGFIGMVPNPESGGAEWGLDFEYRREVEPAALALIIRERLGG